MERMTEDNDYVKCKKLIKARELAKKKARLWSDVERLNDLERELNDMAKGKIPYDKQRLDVIEKALKEMEENE